VALGGKHLDDDALVALGGARGTEIGELAGEHLQGVVLRHGVVPGPPALTPAASSSAWRACRRSSPRGRTSAPSPTRAAPQNRRASWATSRRSTASPGRGGSRW